MNIHIDKVIFWKLAKWILVWLVLIVPTFLFAMTVDIRRDITFALVLIALTEEAFEYAFTVVQREQESEE